jgi:hypothetical protein
MNGVYDLLAAFLLVFDVAPVGEHAVLPVYVHKGVDHISIADKVRVIHGIRLVVV